MSRAEGRHSSRDVVTEVEQYDLEYFFDDSFLQEDMTPQEVIRKLPPSPSRNRGYQTTGTASLVRRDLVESAEPRLSAADENRLTRQMSYCKWKADMLRREMRGVSDATARTELALQVKAYREAGIEVCQYIVRANYPRILAAARDSGIRRDQLDEFVSHAGELMILALDRYDFHKKVRLSTWLHSPLYVWAAAAIAGGSHKRKTQKTNVPFWRLEEGASQVLPDLSVDDEDSRRFAGIALVELLGEAGLNEREQEVLELRHDLQGGEELTLEQIGERLGVTKERIRQILQKAIQKIKAVKPDGRIRDGELE